jgi:hypothetical protein
MSLEDFLSASYALLAEEHQRINPLKDLVSVAQQIAPVGDRPTVHTSVAAKNDESLALLSGMMKGVQKKR